MGLIDRVLMYQNLNEIRYQYQTVNIYLLELALYLFIHKQFTF